MVSMYSMNAGMNQQSGNYFQSLNQKYGSGEIDFGHYAYDAPHPVGVTHRDIFMKKNETFWQKFYRKFIK